MLSGSHDKLSKSAEQQLLIDAYATAAIKAAKTNTKAAHLEAAEVARAVSTYIGGREGYFRRRIEVHTNAATKDRSAT